MDQDDENGLPMPPTHPNCRCIISGVEVPWIIEVRWIMDTIFGDTSPRLPEFNE